MIEYAVGASYFNKFVLQEGFVISDAEVGAKEHQHFQASYAAILKAHMTSLKKRERKDKRKTADLDKKPEGSKKKAPFSTKSS